MPDVTTKETTITTPSDPETTSTQPVKPPPAETTQTVNYIIYFILGLLEILFVFRLIFKITGANPFSGFVSLIYSVTQIFLIPFAGIFRQSTSAGAETTAIFEPAVLIAMVVYAVLAWGIIQLTGILSGKVQE